MSDRSKEEQSAMLRWLNQNRCFLLATYKNQYVAYNASGIVAHSENLDEVLAKANASQQDYLIYLVPKKTASIQIL